jgi:hypothetical protein
LLGISILKGGGGPEGGGLKEGGGGGQQEGEVVCSIYLLLKYFDAVNIC